MAQPIAAIGHITTGHPPFPPTLICEGASTIVVSARCPARVGDHAIPHTSTKKPYSTHGLVVAEGSPTVIYQGKPVGRTGDSMSCSDVIADGIPTIIIGE